MDRRDASQVLTCAQDGSDRRWLGSVGHVNQLKYSWTLPGGADQMSCLLQVPPELRTTAYDPGRLVEIWRGASRVWYGKLDEPDPTADGWQLTAHGAGTFGSDFMAHYTTWNADDPIDKAISRGLRWVNPHIGGTSGLWLSQVEDDAAQSITDHLNLLCTKGALTWYVDASLTLHVVPLPTAVTRLLVTAEPVARTITADITGLWVRYQASANTSGSGDTTYGVTEATLPASAAKHGVMEAYTDLSAAGTVTAAAAKAAGQNVLSRYVRANYAGPFTVSPGQLLTTGGVPVDLGRTWNPAAVCQLLVTDAGYGGEVVPGPVIFPVGAYEYDDQAQTAQITPLQSVRTDLSALLSARYPSPSDGSIKL